MQERGVRNRARGIGQSAAGPPACRPRLGPLQSAGPGPLPRGHSARRSRAQRRRRARRLYRPAHRPLAEGQVHRPRRRHRCGRLVERQPADGAGSLRPRSTPTSSRMPRSATSSSRISSAAPIPPRTCRCASSPNYAWHSLFIRNLLIRPEASELDSFVPEMTIIDLPSFRADPARHGTRSRNRDRHRPHAYDRADRRHRLCRRDEEGGVHRVELSASCPRA